MRSFMYSLIFVVFTFFSCGKESMTEMADDTSMQERIQGAWMSTEPAEEYFSIQFSDDQHVKYTLFVGSKHEKTYDWTYQLQGDSMLIIDRYDTVFKEDAEFKHEIHFEKEGTLHIANLQKDLTSVVGNFPGDVSQGYHDVVFKKKK